MPSPTSKFPSYGLVRGPSHEQGGVAGMVADEQPVELEGGEWIIPKEAVPDYLPVLQQITNEGRAMQQMDNGNSAMDALIASASMQNGLAQPKSPMYQEGGQVQVLRQGKDIEGSYIVSENAGRDGNMFTGQVIMAVPADQVGGGDGLRYYLSKPEKTSMSENFLRTLAQISAKRKMNLTPQDSLPAHLVEGYFDRQKKTSIPDVNNKKTPSGFLKKLFRKKQGGKIEYEDGGRVSVKSKLIDAMSESNGVSKEYSRSDLETLDLDTLERLQSTMMERNTGDQYSGIEDALLSRPGSADIGERRTYANRFDVREGFGPEGRTGTATERLSLGSLPGLAAISNLASRAGVNPEGVMGRVLNAPLPIQRTADIGTGDVSYALTRRQGGPVYQEGGKINKYFEKNTLPYDENVFSDKMAQAGASQNPAGFPGAALYGLGAGLATMPMSDKQRSSGAALVLPALAALYGASKFRSDKAPLKRVMKGKQPLFREIDFKKVDDDVFMSSKKGWRQLSQNAIDSIKENNPELAEFYNFKKGGPVDYYQTGGQVQPRKQQEMRNPAMYYGPPIELMGPDSSTYNEAQSEFEAFMDSLETKRNTNPFTGKPMDTDADVKRLLERMKQSKIPRSGQRMIMRQGGPIPYQNGGEIPDARMMRPSPEAQERLLNDLRAQGAIMGDNPGDRGGYFPLASQVEPDALMGTIRSDRRIKPLEPDTYIQRIPNAGRFDKSGMQFPVYQEEVSQVPKLSTAYLASFGMETPLSREQQALLQRKMIAPETLNPKVKGLINRALVQRLANEED